MKSVHQDNMRSTTAKRNGIAFQFHQGMTPHLIFEQWDCDYHMRSPPSIQTIYNINGQLQSAMSVDPQKTAPKSRSVLTDEKLFELPCVIVENRFIRFESLARILGLPVSTVRDGVKILFMRGYMTVDTPQLTESHMKMHLSFCRTFLFWNEDDQARVWWTDESRFKVEEMIAHQPKKYLPEKTFI